MTYDAFMAKVVAASGKEGAGAVEEACWFIAVHTIREIMDGFRLKDFANLIVHGTPLGGPFQSRADIERWLEDLSEFNETDEEWAWLDAELKSHFGKG